MVPQGSLEGGIWAPRGRRGCGVPVPLKFRASERGVQGYSGIQVPHRGGGHGHERPMALAGGENLFRAGHAGRRFRSSCLMCSMISLRRARSVRPHCQIGQPLCRSL